MSGDEATRDEEVDLQVSPGRATLMALVIIMASLMFSIFVARAPWPPSVFPKYLNAVHALQTAELLDIPQAERAVRLGDYSPLYLQFTRILEPTGSGGLLVANCLLVALASVAVALTVTQLGGLFWGLIAGLLTASYRPLLIQAGVHEPEILLVSCLSLAVLLGVIARGSLARRRAGLAVAGWLAVVGAALAVALAALSRPQWIALVPVWALWIGDPATRRGRFAIWILMIAISGIVIGPVSLSLGKGPVTMNPGPVFYEGNGPAATGLTRHAPLLVVRLEYAHPEAVDYGHVAYRRLASAAHGRPVSQELANRYWLSLAAEALAHRPLDTARLLGRKALMALMPYEAHDLRGAEDLDRRVRRILPWGFGVVLIALPWLLFAERKRLADLAGPIAIAVVSIGVQIAFYASARQRLPLAVALLAIAPVLARDLWSHSLHFTRRRSLSLLLGISFAALVTWYASPVGVLRQLSWIQVMGEVRPSVGESIARWLDGRAMRPELDESARALRGIIPILRSGDREAIESVLPILETLAREHPDLTMDDRTIGVADYWVARALVSLDRRDEAAEAARRAVAVRPSEVLIASLSKRLSEVDPSNGTAVENWRQPGVDPTSARWAMVRAAALDGDRNAARALALPLVAAFPELAPPSTSRSKAPRGDWWPFWVLH